jgi:uncharacterized protein (TIGR02118 family)
VSNDEMYKVAWVARFRPDRPRDECAHHWREVHGPLAAKTPGMLRYIQSHVVGGLPVVADPAPDLVPFVGYSSSWFADEASYQRAMASAEWAALVADSPNLFDGRFFVGMSAALEEHVMRDGPVGPYKVCWVAKFRSDIDAGDARHHWRTVHGPLALEAPGIDRYVQNHAVAALGSGDVELQFAGFSECWFADAETCAAALRSPAWAALRADGYTIFDYEMMWGAELRENVVIA